MKEFIIGVILIIVLLVIILPKKNLNNVSQKEEKKRKKEESLKRILRNIKKLKRTAAKTSMNVNKPSQSQLEKLRQISEAAASKANMMWQYVIRETEAKITNINLREKNVFPKGRVLSNSNSNKSSSS